MQDTATLTSPASLAPLPPGQRIEALDVVRGFALIGICLMNLDFFNRSVLSVGTGLPPGLTGIDYVAAFFTGYFVTGKFWTMFSLLFGMGFAVMLTRAEEAGRAFIQPYLRRIFALAVFGAAHHILLWGGDILFSYAVAALFLLIAMYGGWKTIVGGVILLGCIAAIPGMNDYGSGVPSLLVTGLVALYLRNDTRRFGLPAVSLVAFVVAFLLVVAAVVMLALKVGPQGAAVPMLGGAGVLSLLGWLAKRYQDPASRRPLRAGAVLWVLVFGLMSVGTGIQYFLSQPEGQPAAQVKAPQTAAEKEAAAAQAKQKEEQAKHRKQRADSIARDTVVVSTGTYAEGVALRASQFLKRPPRELGFGMVLMGVFLIGTWFVRSGVMANTGSHLPLFRKLAMVGIPLGIGLGLLGSLVAKSHIAGVNDTGFQFAFGLLMLGSLPASIGYASLVILALHSNSWFSKVRVLAPFGRMALTNYLTQSLVCAVIFYGWGFGNFGMGRAAQLGVALSICAVQVVLCHWWLSHFRYGPLEWLWRAVTYMKLPAMRIDRTPAAAVPLPN
ncbi:DUF418 domain-containing protein [Pseudoduganella sp. GCM10020061]|uniref:DUF418 domain-containing protein n=1 Tax=Pseudoduganella sp. GCM10020061 TaxID=3317345 RepID=UPI003626C72D